MSNLASSNASTTTLSGLQITAGTGPTPVRIPDSLIATRAVETKAGWVGQLIVDGSILWETKPQKTSREAGQKATNRVVTRLRGLLA